MPTLLRTALVIAALAGVTATLLSHRSEDSERRNLLTDLAALGLAERHPEILTDLEHDPDPGRGRVRLARILLAEEIDSSTAHQSADTLEEGLARLALAQRLSRQNLAERPALWQPAMILGAARHLELQRRPEANVLSARAAWQEPLALAHQRAPVEPEPPRLLGAALLGNWSTLPAEDRPAAVGILKRALEEPKSFDLLIGRWLLVAPSFEAALAIMPHDPDAWRKLEELYRGRADRERECRARAGRRRALIDYVERRLDLAARRLRARDRRTAVAELVDVARRIPAEAEFGPPFDRLLTLLPPEPDTDTAVAHAAAARWLGWAGELCLLERCPLSEQGLERLAALTANDLGTRTSVAPGEPVRSAQRWRRTTGAAQTVLETTGPAARIVVIEALGTSSAAIEVLIDGRPALCRAARAGSRILIAAPAPGAHLLELRTLSGGPISASLTPVSPDLRRP